MHITHDNLGKITKSNRLTHRWDTTGVTGLKCTPACTFRPCHGRARPTGPPIFPMSSQTRVSRRPYTAPPFSLTLLIKRGGTVGQGGRRAIYDGHPRPSQRPLKYAVPALGLGRHGSHRLINTTYCGDSPSVMNRTLDGPPPKIRLFRRRPPAPWAPQGTCWTPAPAPGYTPRMPRFLRQHEIDRLRHSWLMRDRLRFWWEVVKWLATPSWRRPSGL